MHRYFDKPIYDNGAKHLQRPTCDIMVIINKKCDFRNLPHKKTNNYQHQQHILLNHTLDEVSKQTYMA